MSSEEKRKEITEALMSEEFDQLYQKAREGADDYYQAVIEAVKEVNKHTPRINECLESEELVALGEKMIRSIVMDIVVNIAEQSDADIEMILHETITVDNVSKAIQTFGVLVTECWQEFVQEKIREIVRDVGERLFMD